MSSNLILQVLSITKLKHTCYVENPFYVNSYFHLTFMIFAVGGKCMNNLFNLSHSLQFSPIFNQTLVTCFQITSQLLF